MSIIATRIDNRLLHGIVATQWAHTVGCTRLMVIDDAVANDPILKEGMKLARPAGVALSIINEETALNNFKIHKYDRDKVFIVTKSPRTLLTLLEQGEAIPKVNVGGTVQVPDGVKLSARAMASAEDVETYKKIAARGVPIGVQYVPADKDVSLNTILDL